MGPTFNGVTQQLVVAATMLQVPLSVCSSLSCDLVGPLTAIRISLFFLAMVSNRLSVCLMPYAKCFGWQPSELLAATKTTGQI